VAALGLASAHQLAYWKDSTALWTHALQVTVSNYVAEENLAVALANDGHDEEAFPHFENVLEIHAEDPTALLNAGMYLQKHGKYREAIEAFNRLIATATDPSDQPRVVAAYRGLGITYTALNDRAKARENFVRAVKLGGEETTDLLNLSIFEADDSAKKLSKELTAHPTAEGYLQLGELLRLSRKLPDARTAYEKALRLNPNLAEAKQALQELSVSAD
jgi:tetratricopeptide (TPR) repeat protein